MEVTDFIRHALLTMLAAADGRTVTGYIGLALVEMQREIWDELYSAWMY